MFDLVVQQLGRRGYQSTLDLQLELRDKVRADSSVEYLLLVEHPLERRQVHARRTPWPRRS